MEDDFSRHVLLDDDDVHGVIRDVEKIYDLLDEIEKMSPFERYILFKLVSELKRLIF